MRPFSQAKNQGAALDILLRPEGSENAGGPSERRSPRLARQIHPEILWHDTLFSWSWQDSRLPSCFCWCGAYSEVAS